MCFHAEAATGVCSTTLTRAHTVRRAADLTPIAKAGHVYAFLPDLRALINSNGKQQAKKVGINRASTFTGFCSKHDNDTFAPLEKHPFTASREQVFLLMYRALAREIHFKHANALSTEQLRELPLGVNYELERLFSEALDAYLLGLRIGLRRLQDIKRHLDRLLLSKTYDELQGIVLWLDRNADVVASGVSNIELDFSDISLHNLADLSRPASMLSLNVLNEGLKSAVVLVWPRDSDSAARRLVSSLCALQQADIPSAILRLLFDSIDNLFMRPDWWESLLRRDREALEERMAQGTPLGFTEGGRARRYHKRSLRDDGRRLVNWRVQSIAFLE